ncbi:MAG: SIS domain-containing protein [Clostridia bacterium]|nr:SIS domain-containing protein [Clostridia bacterium]
MVENIFEELFVRYPSLTVCRDSIYKAYLLLKNCYDNSGKVLCCGNGGSSADCDHLVGELMKGFLKKRPLTQSEKSSFSDKKTAEGLQKALAAISLTTQSGLMTAFENDCDPSLVFAQQVYAYARSYDVLIAFSTSGNSANIVSALDAAKASGISCIAVTGCEESMCSKLSDVCIRLPENETFKIQELTLPVYHCLAAMIEETYFTE